MTERIEETATQILNKQCTKELSNHWNIKLITGSKKPILNIVESVNNGKIFKIKLINSNLRNKCIAYCDELLFRVLSPYRYLNTETMNIISSETEININECIVNWTNELSIIPKEILLPPFLRYVSLLTKQAKEKRITKRYIKITEMLKNVMVRREIHERVNAYEKQLRSEYIKVLYAF